MITRPPKFFKLALADDRPLVEPSSGMLILAAAGGIGRKS